MNLVAKYRKSSSKKGVFILLVGLFSTLVLANFIPKINLSLKKPQANALLSFPQDHSIHPDFNAEWWYLSLMTKTTNNSGEDEKDTGHLISFSSIRPSKESEKINGLLSSTYDNSSKEFKENTDIGGDLQVYLKNQKFLFVNYTNPNSYATLEEKKPRADGKKVYKLSGKTPEIGTFNLKLKERTKSNIPLLWGGNTPNCTGKISVFEPNDTFYYSIPDLDITGTITNPNGEQRNVKIGKAWMDHQWFNNAPPEDWKGHYWTGLHFTESSNLYDSGPHHAIGFVTQFYNDEKLGEIPKYTYWVKRNANGSNQCGTEGSISINNYGETNYPSSWAIDLKKSGKRFLQLTGSPFSDNQIFDPPADLPDFFESASFYSGTLNGKPITGLGFFETHITR